MTKSIISIIKNEHRYIKEWVDFHLNLGFDSIILYEDYGSLSHKSILKNYPNVEIRQLRELGINDYHNCGNQMEMMNRTLEYYKVTKKFDWILYSDPDEFLMIEEGYSMDQMFEEFKNYGGIWLAWKNYGADRHIKRPEGNVVDNYKTPAYILIDNAPHWNKKSFVNVSKADFMKNNHIINNGCDVNKNINPDGHNIYSKIWLNHYFTKSFEDYCERIFDRGNMGNSNRSFDQFFLLNPEFKNVKEKLIRYIQYKHTNNIQYISHDMKIISGGNINEIQKLMNNKL